MQPRGRRRRPWANRRAAHRRLVPRGSVQPSQARTPGCPRLHCEPSSGGVPTMGASSANALRAKRAVGKAKEVDAWDERKRAAPKARREGEGRSPHVGSPGTPGGAARVRRRNPRNAPRRLGPRQRRAVLAPLGGRLLWGITCVGRKGAQRETHSERQGFEGTRKGKRSKGVAMPPTLCPRLGARATHGAKPPDAPAWS